MIKFSLIIPVYNTYDYMEKCLESVIDQRDIKYDYEVIVVDDGSTDGSDKIMKKYEKKYPKIVHYVHKENGGVSSARNLGVEKSKGEYLFFVDSDDYLDPYILSKLEEVIDSEGKPDVIRIDSRDVKGDGELIQNVIIEKSKDEVELIKNIMKSRSLEVPWGYIYNGDFFKKNEFKFPKEVHEDFALIPIVLYKARSIKQLSYIGYNYVEREGSITAENQYEKLKKRVDDMFISYKNHMKVIQRDSKKGKILRSYSMEAMLSKLTTLNDEDMKEKVQELAKEFDSKDLYCYNFKKFIKKVVLKVDIKLYLKMYKQYKI